MKYFLSILLLIAHLSYSQISIKTGNKRYGVSNSSITDSAIYLSNSGSDANNGLSSSAPKQTLVAAMAAANARNGRPVKILMDASSTFKEYTTANNDNISWGYYNYTKSLPLLEGADVFNTGWTASGTHSYTHVIANNVHNYGGYGEMLVVEVDTLLERTQPLTARRYFKISSSITNCDTTAATSYTGTGAGASVTLYIHPSDNSNPNNNARFRYEVTTRDKAVQANADGATASLRTMNFEGLYVRDWGGGVGALSAGYNSTYNKILSQGGTVHSLVIPSGTITNSAFIGGSNMLNSGAVIFYATQGQNEHSTIANSIFINNYYPFGAHTSTSDTKHRLIEINNVAVWPNPVDQAAMYFCNNTDTILFDRLYVDGDFQIISSNGSAATTIFRNSVMANYTLWDNNTPGERYYLTNNLLKSYGNGVSGSSGYVSVQNCTIDAAGGSIIATNGTDTTFSQRNILVGRVNAAYGASNNPKNKFDYNVYVALGDLRWNNPGFQPIYSFSEWQTTTGQDAHSHYIDLRGNAAGIKAVFIDPDNGNYNLVSGGWGDSIRTWQAAWGFTAGMLTPTNHFFTKPTYEQIYDMVANENMIDVGSLFTGGATTATQPGKGIIVPSIMRIQIK